MKERNVAVSVILCFVTCGIYQLFWLYSLTDDVNYAFGEADTSGGTALLLSIITCHFYTLYWAYKMGEKIDRIKNESGYPSSNSGILYLILVLFGLDIVVFAIMQNELNHMSFA